MNKEIPNSIILDQYSNPNNPLAHYHGTAEEIIEACGDHLDMAVIGAGTGGTITGVAKRLKEEYPGIIIVGVDPIGSILSNMSSHDQLSTPYQVEGIGYDFVPQVLDRSLIDLWIATNDPDSFAMARRLIRSEGLLCGGSSGSAAWAAIQAIRSYNFASDPSKRVLVILPDSVRNYMSKFLSSDWMLRNKFMSVGDFEREQGFKHVACNGSQLQLISIPTIKSTDSIKDVLEIVQTIGLFPVINPVSHEIIGNFDSRKLLETILREGKTSVLLSVLKRFINKDFMLFNPYCDTNTLLTASAANIPIYFVDSSGKAILSQEGLVQIINPFHLLNMSTLL